MKSQSPLEYEYGSRQQQVLELLARRGSMTIAEMADIMGLAKTSLRPQIERLVLQGSLDRQSRRQGPGRPADVFSVSAQGRRRFAQQSMDDFGRVLLEELVATLPKPKLQSILKGVGRRLNRMLGPVVGGDSSEDRLRQLSKFLNERGILNEISRSGNSAALSIYTCPYAGLADNHREICKMDRGMISSFIGGKILPCQCMCDGDSHCELRMEVTPQSPASSRRNARRSAGRSGSTKRRP